MPYTFTTDAENDLYDALNNKTTTDIDYAKIVHILNRKPTNMLSCVRMILFNPCLEHTTKKTLLDMFIASGFDITTMDDTNKYSLLYDYWMYNVHESTLYKLLLINYLIERGATIEKSQWYNMPCWHVNTMYWNDMSSVVDFYIMLINRCIEPSYDFVRYLKAGFIGGYDHIRINDIIYEAIDRNFRYSDKSYIKDYLSCRPEPIRWQKRRELLEYIDCDSDFIKYMPGHIGALEAEKSFMKLADVKVMPNMNKLKFLY